MGNDKSLKNKRIFKGILAGIIALCSIYSWTLPISSEFCKMSWIMKALTGGSILCGLAFYVIVITLSVKNGKKNKKYYYDILYASPLLVLETLNVLAIFDYEIWGHKSTLAGLSLVIIMFVELFASIRTIFKKSFGQENTPVTLLALTVISFVLAAVNEGAGNIEPANLCYKVCFGLAYLVAIALYTHQFIYKTKKSEKIISTIIGIIFWGAAITITFPYYVKWCGLSETAFETFVSVYAAVLGGGITLAGVAWTIKDANDDKKKDLILQNKPILYAHMMNVIDALKQTPIDMLFLDFKRIKSIKTSEDATNCEAKSAAKETETDKTDQLEGVGSTITLKSLVNTDNSIVIVKKVMVNDIELTPINNSVMAKSKAYNLILHVDNITDKDDIKLYAEDVLKNPYCFTILPYIHKDKKGNDQYGIMRIEEYKSEVPNE